MYFIFNLPYHSVLPWHGACWAVKVHGQRWPAIHHARIRTGCSKLNCDVAFNLHIPNVLPDCACGNGYENAEHFFMHCEKHNDIRETLKAKVEEHCEFRLKVLLVGSEQLPVTRNQRIFDAVHKFIVESHRFD